MGVRAWWADQDTAVKLIVAAVAVLVLLVVFVVVLVVVAALLGAFVLGMGEQATADQPQAEFSAAEVDDDVVVTHEDGEQIEADRVTLELVGEDRVVDWTETDGTIDPGDSYEIHDAPADPYLKILWENDDGETTTLAAFKDAS